MYATKNTITITVYLSPTARPKSCCIPATSARPRFVRSTREMEYISPSMGSNLRSTFRLAGSQYYLYFNFGLKEVNVNWWVWLGFGGAYMTFF